MRISHFKTLALLSLPLFVGCTGSTSTPGASTTNSASLGSGPVPTVPAPTVPAPTNSPSPTTAPSPVPPSGVPWAGIVSGSRAIDWRNAGVEGGIPTRNTICATLNPGATAAQINSAINSCPSGQVVFLNAGTYNISDNGIVMKSGVTVRGAGASQTILNFRNTNSCGGAWASVCFMGSGSENWSGSDPVLPGGSNAANWTGGYAQGSNQITLSNIGSSTISVGQYIMLDQANDTSIGNDFFVCDTTTASCSLEGGNGGRVINGVLRSQVQMVKVTAINGNVYTISPGLYSPNWRSSQSPGAWWPSRTIQYSGLENVTVDSTNAGGIGNISMFNAANSWVKGVRLLRMCTCNRQLINLGQSTHITILDNYFYGTQGQSQNYGVESYILSDSLIQNNIFQHVVAPLMLQMNMGSVYGYNYGINNTYADSQGIHWMSGLSIQHNAGVEYILHEGNVGPGFASDVFHGNQLANTLFRNYYLGTDPGRVDATSAITILSFNRFFNIIGNVLGTPGYSNIYQASGGSGQTRTIFNIGSGNSNGSVTVPNDPLVISTLFRWGNYDTATGTSRFLASEVPSTLSNYSVSVPSSQALPASFYNSSKPAWWPTAKAWPPIGPDVTGGNIAGLGGHANTIPAQDCYLNVMRGPVDGSGSYLNFDADACYGR